MNDKNLFNEAKDSIPMQKNNFYKNVFKTAICKPSCYIPSIILLIIFLTGFILSLVIEKETLTAVNFENALIYPNSKYLFGTNEFGQNMFHTVLIGTYRTLTLAIGATFLNILVGIIIGVIWGNSNKFNSIMIFIKGIFDSLPKTFLFIIVIFALGSNFASLLLVIIVFNWVNVACLVRNNLILIRNKDYNIASKLNKTSLFKIATHNYLPSLLPIIFNSIAISIPDIIALELTIYCFEFSIIDNSVSLGNIIYSSISKNIYLSYPFLFFIPLIILFIINICVFSIGKTLSHLAIKEGEK